MKNESLFQPIKIGKMEVKNKISMAPMGAFGLVDNEGCYNQRAIDYYVERAKGGTGLIITSITKVENELDKVVPGIIPVISINPGRFLMTSSEMTERVHAYGAKIFLQLTMGFGRSGAPGTLLTSQPVSASDIPNYWDPTVTCRALTTSEVEWIVSKFIEGADIAQKAGFDGVEIHAVHEGYLLDQFTLSIFNRRTDKYGGDLRGRLQLPIEIVQGIKARLGDDFPVGLRYSVKSCIKDWRQGGLPDEDYVEKGRDLKEGLNAAKILEAAGYDELNTDVGTYDAWYWSHPPIYQKNGLYLPYTKELKKVVKIPVIVAGKLGIPEDAEKALDDEAADMVGLGRPLLADPYWPKKVLSNNSERIRPCIGCHTGCLGRGFEGKPLSCTVNPAVGRERYYEIKPTLTPKKVMVVGGGVAGMEAARIIKMRGHDVTIYEGTDKLGGVIIPGSVPDFKVDDRRLIDWYKNEIKELEVKVNFNTKVTEELVEKEKPDVVIIATGAKEIKINVPGIEKDKVITAVELLNGTKKVGNNVLIVGGGLVGCEAALYLAKQGKNVTIVEAKDTILSAGKPIPHMNKIMLIDLLNMYNVKTITSNSLLEVTDKGAVLINNKFKKQEVSADTVAIAVGFKSDRELYNKLNGKITDLYLIGDAYQAANIMDAIWSANEIALNC
ncbi:MULTISPECIES: FAD-dependent oxidoreductase [Clostridium]|uniref:2-enoate reductase FldZ n=1 Tax=Clostridium ragsdalei P11 TaxID=1353534 RepID=A0A1A6ALZ5_9CLOT|nr:MULTISPECIES: FAD-dependent oxidoreductase [Clostridium]OBR91097.1 2-enoate reductase FldZ [Clostridium ragsdalei P11]QXE18436.1 2-enoate reductase [Clostridium sp. 001]